MYEKRSTTRNFLGYAGSALDQLKTAPGSVAAAARVHPAGFALPSTVIVAAVAFFTFVTAAIVRVIPPALFGAGSPPTIQSSTSQPRHRVLPQQAIPTGPPVSPHLVGSQWPGATSPTGQGQHAGSPPPKPPTPATSPVPGSGSTPGVGQALAPSSSGTTPATVTASVPGAGSVGAQVSQMVSAKAAVSAASYAVQSVIPTAVNGVSVPAVVHQITSSSPVTRVAAVTSAAVGTVTSSAGSLAHSAAPVSVSVSLDSSNQSGSSQQAPTHKATATAADAQVTAGSSGASADVRATLGNSGSASSQASQAVAATATVSTAGKTGSDSKQPVTVVTSAAPAVNAQVSAAPPVATANAQLSVSTSGSGSSQPSQVAAATAPASTAAKTADDSKQPVAEVSSTVNGVVAKVSPGAATPTVNVSASLSGLG